MKYTDRTIIFIADRSFDNFHRWKKSSMSKSISTQEKKLRDAFNLFDKGIRITKHLSLK